MLEVELKFAVDSFEGLRPKLRSIGSRIEGPYLEENKVFDTRDRKLYQAGMLLRLRKAGDRSVLCLKRPPKVEGDFFKVMEEIETMIKEDWAMEQILEYLDLEVSFCYEKIREKWQAGDAVVCLDLLPFGKYVEIEGQEDEIRSVAGELSLEMGCGITKNYHQLHQEYLLENGLPLTDSFMFNELEKERLLSIMSRDGQV